MPETNDERWHRRQRELRACRCAECRAHYEENPILDRVIAIGIEQGPHPDPRPMPPLGPLCHMCTWGWPFMDRATCATCGREADLTTDVLARETLWNRLRAAWISLKISQQKDQPPHEQLREAREEQAKLDEMAIRILTSEDAPVIEIGPVIAESGPMPWIVHPCVMRDTPGGRCCSVCGRFE